ncbi:MAG TPA: hypothetical protein PLQ49_03975 [Methanothrix sp.]|nr:hypothetical protein [Methanothrix sp.]
MAGVVNGTINVSDNASDNASNNASNNASESVPNMTNQTSAEDLNVSVVELSTVDNGTDAEEGAETTVISYSPSAGVTEEGVAEGAEVEVIGAGALEPTELGALAVASEASATGNASDLSTIGEETEVASTTNATEPMDVAALGEGLNASAGNATDLSTLGEATAVASTTNLTEPMDVRVLGNVLFTPPADNVRSLSTLGNVTAAEPADETEPGFASLSNATFGSAESTDVKDLSAALGIEFNSEVVEEA